MEPNNLHPGNAIWDDGEWVSWDEINRHIHHSDEGDLLAQMIQLAKDYLDLLLGISFFSPEFMELQEPG